MDARCNPCIHAAAVDRVGRRARHVPWLFVALWYAASAVLHALLRQKQAQKQADELKEQPDELREPGWLAMVDDLKASEPRYLRWPGCVQPRLAVVRCSCDSG